MRRSLIPPIIPVLILGFGVAACSDIDSPSPLAPDAAPAFGQQATDAIPGQYIVVLHDGADDVAAAARQLAAAHGGAVGFVYRAALRGFSISNMSAQAAAALERNPRVAYVEPDQVVTAWATQSSATWGLDRIDQRALPLNATYQYDATGSGVRAYIIDTGIRYTHTDFGARASFGFDAFGGNGGDCNGHGTHVAGTTGGATWGVAKATSLVAVRVLDCNGSGTTSGVIAGVDWVSANHVKPAVANMSLGGGASSTLDAAVRNSIAAGVTYSVAAGNGDFIGRARDACNYSPARVTEAITVGATNSTDTKASWSNYGNCVDLFAPGVSITSAWHTSNTATNTISGTSMAAPHVAGVAALYLQVNPGASPATVAQAIHDASTKNIVTSSNTANNHLLYSLFGSAPPPPANSPPTASFTYSCSGLTCDFTDTSTDSEGSISSWAWTFGDGTSATQQNPSKTYTAGGTWTVSLTVTDNDGATGNTSQGITVTAPSAGGITLSVTAYKVQGRKHADLLWSGATSASSIDVFRDGTKVATVPNNGAYTHATTERGGGSHSYRVCAAGTSTCSPDVTVTY
jgi:subtilisin family serine protease